MYQNLINGLVKCLADTLVTLEFLEAGSIDEDIIVQLFEQIGYHLQNLTPSDKLILEEAFFELSESYPEEVREYVKRIPENFGISNFEEGREN